MHTNNTNSCVNSDLCSINDQCLNGVCANGPPLNCSIAVHLPRHAWYVHKHTQHTHAHTHTHTHTHTTHTHTQHTHTHAHTYINTLLQHNNPCLSPPLTHAHTHTYIYIYIHKHTHTHTTQTDRHEHMQFRHRLYLH